MTLEYLRPKPLLIIALVLITCAALIVYARTRANKTAFSLAQDFPRGAVVYAQFKDLPGLIKQWDQSRLWARFHLWDRSRRSVRSPQWVRSRRWVRSRL